MNEVSRVSSGQDLYTLPGSNNFSSKRLTSVKLMERRLILYMIPTDIECIKNIQENSNEQQ